MKPINTSIFDFPGPITGGYVYVDKTMQIYELAKPNADRVYFFPRPRFWRQRATPTLFGRC